MMSVHELADLLEFGNLRPALMDDEDWLIKVGFIQMMILQSLNADAAMAGTGVPGDKA